MLAAPAMPTLANRTGKNLVVSVGGNHSLALSGSVVDLPATPDGTPNWQLSFYDDGCRPFGFIRLRSPASPVHFDLPEKVEQSYGVVETADGSYVAYTKAGAERAPHQNSTAVTE